MTTRSPTRIFRPLLLTALLAFLVAGCSQLAGKAGTKVVFHGLSADGPTRTLDAVEVLDASALPRGIRVVDGDVYLDPLGGARVIGYANVDAKLERDEAIRALRAEAAGHGADAIILLPDLHGCTHAPRTRCRRAHAIVRGTADAASGAGDAAIESWHAANPRAGTRAAATESIDLASPEPIVLRLRRGECPTVVFARDADAVVFASTLVRPVLDVSGPDAYYALSRPMGADNKATATAIPIPCALDDVEVSLRVRQPKAEAPLGEGRLAVHVYVKPVGDSQLAKEKGAFENEAARNAAERAKDAERACASCRPKWLACVARNPKISVDGCADYNWCLQTSRSRIKPRECGR